MLYRRKLQIDSSVHGHLLVVRNNLHNKLLCCNNKRGKSQTYFEKKKKKMWSEVEGKLLRNAELNYKTLSNDVTMCLPHTSSSALQCRSELFVALSSSERQPQGNHGISKQQAKQIPAIICYSTLMASSLHSSTLKKCLWTSYIWLVRRLIFSKPHFSSYDNMLWTENLCMVTWLL